MEAKKHHNLTIMVLSLLHKIKLVYRNRFLISPHSSQSMDSFCIDYPDCMSDCAEVALSCRSASVWPVLSSARAYFPADAIPLDKRHSERVVSRQAFKVSSDT